MPLRLDIKKKLSNRSERVKAVDFHPTEPWLLTALYNGNVYIWNHETQTVVKTFEITELPVRAAKFIARKSWLVTGSDDMQVKVFNYNTHEKVTAFEAHGDYIRSIAVHATQSYLLTSSDDMSIKLWDWEKGWKNVMVFEGHAHYVMQVIFNPKDGNTFASASLDQSIKVWSLGSSVANYTLTGHTQGVNCIDYYHGGDKPYLVSGADDKLVKVWDYQNKTCVQTLEGHTQNTTIVAFHPELPLIISGSEDGTVRLWHANTYRLENTLNYGMERVWSVGYIKGSNDLAFGYDEGTIAIKLGREEPAISMDNSGKIIWAKHSEIQTGNIKSAAEEELKDGERIALPSKDLGSCEIYPQTLTHSPNGRFVVVCGDGEYIIYTALAWRNKSFGQALEFVWATDSNEYAIRESTSKIRVFKSFKEKAVNIKPNFSIDGIFGGALIGVKGSGFLCFYDWDTGVPVRRVDVAAKNVYWSESDLVAITCDDSFYVLKFNRVAYQKKLDSGVNFGEEGIEEAFDFITEVSETVKTGAWVGDCFIYTNSLNRLNYLVGGQTFTISHFDMNMYLLGYIPRDNRAFLADKDMNIFSYSVPLSMIEYQTAVLRGDMDHAQSVLPNVPKDQLCRIARFLDGQDLKEKALMITTDNDHKFDLAIQLNRLDIAYEIAVTVDREDRWKTVGDAALSQWKFQLAEQCMIQAKDIEGLLMFYQASGNSKGLKQLAVMSAEKGKNNITFLCHLLLSEVEECTNVLKATNRVPEAALMARTYTPTLIESTVNEWKLELLKETNAGDGLKKQVASLADPINYPNLFPNFEYAVAAEEIFKKRRDKGFRSGKEYTDWKDSMHWDVVGELKQRFPDGIPQPNSELAQPVAATFVDDGSPNHHHHSQQQQQQAQRVTFDEETSDERLEYVSDNLSHLSLEVNTTGTGSARGDIDFDDMASFTTDSVGVGEQLMQVEEVEAEK